MRHTFPFRTTPAVLMLLVLLAVSALGGCGYQFVSQGKVALPEDIKTLAIKRVDNPSMETWLPAELIARFRDEITSRAQLRWVDKADADALVYIDIEFFDVTTAVSDDKGQTEQYVATIKVRARIRRRLTNAEVWDSGYKYISERFLASDQQSARRKAVELAVRQIVDSMQNAY